MKRALAIALVLAIIGPAALAEARCAEELELRPPLQVVADLRAALAAADWEAVACQYARSAFVIDDQGVLVGREEIVSSLMSLDELFGGVQPDIQDETVHEHVVRTLFSLDGGWIVIPDGVDTYLIKKGRIRFQTRHGIIEFTGPPPEQ